MFIIRQKSLQKFSFTKVLFKSLHLKQIAWSLLNGNKRGVAKFI
jgi:hypothetical protein